MRAHPCGDVKRSRGAQAGRHKVRREGDEGGCTPMRKRERRYQRRCTSDCLLFNAAGGGEAAVSPSPPTHPQPFLTRRSPRLTRFSLTADVREDTQTGADVTTPRQEPYHETKRRTQRPPSATNGQRRGVLTCTREQEGGSLRDMASPASCTSHVPAQRACTSPSSHKDSHGCVTEGNPPPDTGKVALHFSFNYRLDVATLFS